MHILQLPMLSGGAQQSPATEGQLHQLRHDARIRLQVLWHMLLAAPFALSLVLTLVVGPSTIDDRYTSFIWLAGASLFAALLMLRVSGLLLVPIGFIICLLFPPLIGVGFYFAPDWLQPGVWISFYGASLAASAAILTGIASGLRLIMRSRRARVAIRTAGPGLLGLAAVMLVSASANAAAPWQADSAAATNLGSTINTAHREAEPAFTSDGRTMYFNCSDYDICVSHLSGTWEDSQWSTPQILPAPISTAYPDVEPVINAAGDRLYFTSMRPFSTGKGVPGLAQYVEVTGLTNDMTMGRLGLSLFNGLGEDDIWVSDLKDGIWSEPRNLSDVPGAPPVNTIYKDHCFFLSADGNEAFWTSTRPGGLGGNDIWTSRRVDGVWTAPENLGPNVNGPASEHHSILSPDGHSLYVTSNRPGGFGNDDIYVTTRGTDGTWSQLVNLGPLVNGPGNDRCPLWTPDGRILLFDSDRAGGYGSKDLWWVYFADLDSKTPGSEES